MTKTKEVLLLEAAPDIGKESAYRAEICIEGHPSQVLWENVNLKNGAFTSGIWEGRTGTLNVQNYPFNEVLTIHSGWLELTDENGPTRRIEPGMSAYIPKGWCGIFKIGETTRKTYVLYSGE